MRLFLPEAKYPPARLISESRRVHEQHDAPLNTKYFHLVNVWSSRTQIPRDTLRGQSCNLFKMATARLPQKRILGESTNTQRNIPSSPASAKKRKLEPVSSPAARFKSSQNGPKGKVGSSQPSHFESEVLEKMTQDMAGLKNNNSEKDQEWARPSLEDFNPQTDNLCFQQIEAEEGTLNGGKTTVKLFGVTEASLLIVQENRQILADNSIDRPLRYASCYRLPPLPLRRCSSLV